MVASWMDEVKLEGSAVHGKGGVRHLPNHSPNFWIPGSLVRRKGEGTKRGKDSGQALIWVFVVCKLGWT